MDSFYFAFYVFTILAGKVDIEFLKHIQVSQFLYLSKKKKKKNRKKKKKKKKKIRNLTSERYTADFLYI